MPAPTQKDLTESPDIKMMVQAPAGWSAVFEVGGVPEKRPVASWLMLGVGKAGGTPVPASVVGGVGPLLIPEMLPNFLGYDAPGTQTQWEAVAREAVLMRGMQRLGPLEWKPEDLERRDACRWTCQIKGILQAEAEPHPNPAKGGWRWHVKQGAEVLAGGAGKTLEEARQRAVRNAALLVMGVKPERS